MKKVLHVETDPRVREKVKRYLQEKGDFKVLHAVTPRQALDCVEDDHFALVITDRTLITKNDGIDLAKTLMADYPVLILSSDNSDEPVGIPILTAPCTAQALVENVLRMLANEHPVVL